MIKFLTENFKWIAFIVILLIISNLLTGISINSLSRKERQKIQHERDSLEDRFKQLDFVHKIESDKRRKIFLEDSLLKVKYLQIQIEDAILIKQQAFALTKFKSLSSKRNLQLLDSAYDAENTH